MNQIARIDQRGSPVPLKRQQSITGNSFLRLLTARVVSTVTRTSPAEVAARSWPRDRVVADILERATATPAMTTTAGWAAELVQVVVADALAALGPASAGAEVLRRGLVLSFDGAGAISAPGFVASAANAAFVAEGEPIPVQQLGATPASILAHKIASIAVLTREMIESSNAEKLIGDALMGAAGAALDAVLFDANAATAARPAGLRSGIAALTASNNADMREAVAEDVSNLLGAVGVVGGNGPYAIVMSPGRVGSVAIRADLSGSNVVFLASPAVGTAIIAIATSAIAAALSPSPDIESSKAATLHMDTAPTAVGSAAPGRSLFQTDSIGLKLRWPVSWALRDARGVAWTTPAWK